MKKKLKYEGGVKLELDKSEIESGQKDEARKAERPRFKCHHEGVSIKRRWSTVSNLLRSQGVVGCTYLMQLAA